jgi:hypothetical protein
VTDLRGLITGRVQLARRGLGIALDAARLVLAPVGRRVPEILVGLGVVLTALVALVLVGAARNDASITHDRGVAVGEVLEGSDAQHTFIRFTASDGAVLTPENGVLYPRGLEPGNYVLVEYDRSKPELVRVADRNWTEGLAPAGLGVVGLWVVLGPLAWYLGRRRRSGADDETPVGPEVTTPPESAPSAPEADVESDEAREPVGAGR